MTTKEHHSRTSKEIPPGAKTFSTSEPKGFLRGKHGSLENSSGVDLSKRQVARNELARMEEILHHVDDPGTKQMFLRSR